MATDGTSQHSSDQQESQSPGQEDSEELLLDPPDNDYEEFDIGSQGLRQQNHSTPDLQMCQNDSASALDSEVERDFGAHAEVHTEMTATTQLASTSGADSMPAPLRPDTAHIRSEARQRQKAQPTSTPAPNCCLASLHLAAAQHTPRLVTQSTPAPSAPLWTSPRSGAGASAPMLLPSCRVGKLCDGVNLSTAKAIAVSVFEAPAPYIHKAQAATKQLSVVQGVYGNAQVYSNRRRTTADKEHTTLKTPYHLRFVGLSSEQHAPAEQAPGFSNVRAPLFLPDPVTNQQQQQCKKARHAWYRQPEQQQEAMDSSGYYKP